MKDLMPSIVCAPGASPGLPNPLHSPMRVLDPLQGLVQTLGHMLITGSLCSALGLINPVRSMVRLHNPVQGRVHNPVTGQRNSSTSPKEQAVH